MVLRSRSHELHVGEVKPVAAFDRGAGAVPHPQRRGGAAGCLLPPPGRPGRGGRVVGESIRCPSTAGVSAPRANARKYPTATKFRSARLRTWHTEEKMARSMSGSTPRIPRPNGSCLSCGAGRSQLDRRVTRSSWCRPTSRILPRTPAIRCISSMFIASRMCPLGGHRWRKMAHPASAVRRQQRPIPSQLHAAVFNPGSPWCAPATGPARR